MFSDRRKSNRRDEDERRQDEPVAAAGDDRRVASRRDGGERRKWKCGLLFKTSEGAGIIEDWLDDNAKDDWNLVLDDLDAALSGKTFRIMFADEQDKSNFMIKFSRNSRAA